MWELTIRPNAGHSGPHIPHITLKHCQVELDLRESQWCVVLENERWACKNCLPWQREHSQYCHATVHEAECWIPKDYFLERMFGTLTQNVEQIREDWRSWTKEIDIRVLAVGDETEPRWVKVAEKRVADAESMATQYATALRRMEMM